MPLRQFVLGLDMPRASLALGLVTVFSVVVQGFDFGAINNSFHLVFLQRLADPTLFPNDPFADIMKNYFSLFWVGVSWIDPGGSWPVFLGLHIAARWLLLVALYAILKRLTEDVAAPLFTVAFLSISFTLHGYSVVGRQELLATYLTHSNLALALMFSAYALALHDRWVTAFALCGLLFNVNAFMAVWASGVLAVLIGLSWWNRSGPKIRPFAKATAMAALLAMPTAIWILHSGLGPDSISTFDYREYLRVYASPHYLIEASTPERRAHLALLFLAGVAAAAMIGDLPPRTGHGASLDSRRKAMALLAGHAFLFVIGLVLPNLTSSRWLLNLHLLRVDGPIIILSAAFAATHAMSLAISTAEPTDRRVGASFALSGVAFAVPAATLLGTISLVPGIGRWPLFAVAVMTAVILAISGVFVETSHALILSVLWLGVIAVALAERPWMQISAGALGVAVMVANGGAAATAVLGYGAARCAGKEGGSVSWAAGALGAAAAATLLALSDSPTWAAILALASFISAGACMVIPSLPVLVSLKGHTTILAVCLAAFVLTAPKLAIRVSEGSLSTEPPSVRALIAAQRWARENTPPDAIFLTPPDLEVSWPAFSGRSSWIERRFGGVVAIDPRYYPIWKSRLEARNTEDLGVLAQRERIDYVVLPRSVLEGPLSADAASVQHWPIVYKNQWWEIRVVVADR